MKGYEQISALAARFPEVLIIRRFDKLTARILLRLQAELLHLENDLEVFIEEDARRFPDITTCWQSLDRLEKPQVIHLKKYEEAEQKLKTYQETVLRARDIRSMSHPTQQTLSLFRDWLGRRDGGDNFLQGIEAEPWATEGLDELLSMQPGQSRLDSWLNDFVTPLYHKLYGCRRKPDIDLEVGLGHLWTYKATWLQHLGDLICVVVSSIAPVASIHGLYWIATATGRLFLITGLIILFPILLMFVAGCRRSEVFAATSAFAAVLVVFLQGLDGTINYAA